MNETMVVNVSPSVLGDVLSCETRGWAKHVKGFTSKGDAIKALAGQAMHAGIAKYLDPSATAGATLDEALRVMHRVYDEKFAMLSADQLEPALTPANLHRLLSRWIETHPPGVLPWKRVLHVEEAFVSRVWYIGNTTVKLIVRPDIVVEDFEGRVRFVDTKTTGWRIADNGWRRNLRLSMQLALYCDAVAQKYGDRAVLGGWINAMELRQLPGSTEAPPRLKKDGTPMKARSCAEHGVPYAECGHEHAKMELIECMTTPERIERAVADARAGAERFVRLRGVADPSTLAMDGSAKEGCRFCPAADWCEAGRVPEAMEAFMVYEPWVVDEGQRELG